MARRDLNKIQIIGNLGRDPEMRYTPGGTPVTEFSVAVNRPPRRGQDGQATEETDWFRVVCWDKLAEITDQYLKKGSRVYIEGRLQIRKYTGNDGVDRTSVEIIARDMLMLSGREEGGYAGREEGGTRREPASSRSGDSGEEDFDDLPF
ncbi:single-stranded DNA-binding protein [Nitrolancea hollandica]|uniref:Single-stranded DNA-binding protein n=1 Tax=Nitrolancea hollandica Lb TaxID=1129897 RepID=I4EDL5_9BACT|nr:single-stranded DNA-binding protein [Nitrolancea hollandica]CCF82777.1 Single-stranded DNA-binding protein [Nitrolancea hollandica Lb]